MSFAVFILSTGRCGTQWIAKQLKEIYFDSFHVEHEPLHNNYRPRQMLNACDPINLGSDYTHTLLSHIEEIENKLKEHSYIECGHPCWSTLPYLIKKFNGRIRIIHLVRHPISTSFSWITHGAFQPPLLSYMEEKVLLSPFDDGVFFKEYQDHWSELNQFEKCLYYWAEVNAFGLNLETKIDFPWLRLKFEDLFSNKGIEKLLTFLNLPNRESIFTAKDQLVDKYHYITNIWYDPKVIDYHPKIVDIAKTLDYDIHEIDKKNLFARYTGAL